ncbi:YceI family protein [Aliiroseovarius sp.]|uniref:YceI family protein n=1 Tax=Aliiroseovarius sp. TaxID=1872442 RepID=UPI003BAB88A0
MKHLFAPLLLLALLLTTPVRAEPVRYELDRARSMAGFVVETSQQEITGSFPILEAEVLLDFERNRDSRIRVSVDAARARTNLPFASQAIRSRDMLNTERFPVMTFESRALRIARTSAVLSGDMKIRGVTHPVNLDAQVFRQRGTDPGDLSRLAVHVTGTVRRSDFGVTGLPNMVDEEIRLNIIVRLDRDDG